MSSYTKEYKATLGMASRIITSLVIIFFIGQIFFFAHKNSVEPRKEWAFAAAFMILLLLLPVITYLYRPKAYMLDGQNFYISRIAGSFRIPLSVITTVQQIPNSDLRFSIRTFGNGGLFGYTGYFRNSKLGKMRWFVSQRKNYVLIETNDGAKFVVSPDEPGQLLVDFQPLLSSR